MNEKPSFKNIDIPYNTMKTFVFLFLAIGLVSAQYLTLNSCNDYSLGSNSALGFIAPGVYPLFPVFNFTVFNTMVTKQSDLPLYNNLCNKTNNVFYGFNASLQTCSSHSSSSNAVWSDTGFSTPSLSVSLSLANDSNFTYLPVNPNTNNLTVFYKQNPQFANSLNKTVINSSSQDSLNFTFYDFGFNTTSKCYFPINITASNFSVKATSTSSNGSLVLIQSQNETIAFDNSTGILIANASFSGKEFNYEYTGALPASFNIFVERLDNPNEVTGLLIDQASLQVYFTSVKQAGLEVSYYSPSGHGTLLNEANPFDLKLSNVKGWDVEFKTDSILNATLSNSFGVANINLTITKTLGAIQKAEVIAKSFISTLLSSSVDKAKASADAQLSNTKIAENNYNALLSNCNYDLKTMQSAGMPCDSLPSCSQALGSPYNFRYSGFHDCDSYARAKSGYTG
jgi:hypothetical protein